MKRVFLLFVFFAFYACGGGGSGSSGAEDNERPDTLITNLGLLDDPTSETTRTYQFTCSDGPVPNSNCTYQCRFNGGPWGECSSPETYEPLTLGSYLFEVVATDLSGNTDLSPASDSWSVVPLWSQEILDSADPWEHMWTNLTFDNNDNAHIVLYNDVATSVNHVYKNLMDDTWNEVAIDFSGDVGGWPSSVFDGVNLHVFYHDFDNADLKHAERDVMGNWSVNGPAGYTGLANNTGKFSSAALNTVNGSVYAAFQWDADASCLLNACKDEIRYTGTPLWESPVIKVQSSTNTSQMGDGLSLIFVGGDEHIAFHHAGTLWFLDDASELTVIDDVNSVGTSPSLGYDADNSRFYVAYWAQNKIKIASSATNGVSWETFIFGDGQSDFAGIDMKIDNGTVHVCWTNPVSPSQLLYRSGTWDNWNVEEVVDTNVDPDTEFSYCSIDTDSSGVIKISYVESNSTDSHLKLATRGS